MSRQKQITNPVDRALEAYFDLDDAQKAEFDAVLRNWIRFAEKLGHSAGLPAPIVKRGRPLGSKTRNHQVAEPLRDIINAASEAGL